MSKLLQISCKLPASLPFSFSELYRRKTPLNMQPVLICFTVIDVICILSLITMAHSLYKHGYVYKIQETDPKKCALFQRNILLGVFFIMTTIFGIAGHLLCIITFDIHSNAHGNIYVEIYGGLYGLQFLILIIVWFTRICISFYGTSLAISRRTINSFVIIYVIFVILVCIVNPPWLIGSTKYIVFALAFLLFLFLLGGLNGLFIYKLCIICRNSDYRNDYIHLISKMCILNFISLFLTIISITAIFVKDEATILNYISLLIVLIDMYSNAICMMLSYNQYENYYNKVCGPLHNLCCYCCIQIKSANSDSIGLQHVIEGSTT